MTPASRWHGLSRPQARLSHGSVTGWHLHANYMQSRTGQPCAAGLRRPLPRYAAPPAATHRYARGQACELRTTRFKHSFHSALRVRRHAWSCELTPVTKRRFRVFLCTDMASEARFCSGGGNCQCKDWLNWSGGAMLSDSPWMVHCPASCQQFSMLTATITIVVTQ